MWEVKNSEFGDLKEVAGHVKNLLRVELSCCVYELVSNDLWMRGEVVILVLALGERVRPARFNACDTFLVNS